MYDSILYLVFRFMVVRLMLIAYHDQPAGPSHLDHPGHQHPDYLQHWCQHQHPSLAQLHAACQHGPQHPIEQQHRGGLNEGIGQDVAQPTAELAYDVMEQAVGGAQQHSNHKVTANAEGGADLLGAALRVLLPPA